MIYFKRAEFWLTRRVRDELLSVAGRLARDGETQLKQSPENPGRFMTPSSQELESPGNSEGVGKPGAVHDSILSRVGVSGKPGAVQS